MTIVAHSVSLKSLPVTNLWCITKSPEGRAQTTACARRRKPASKTQNEIDLRIKKGNVHVILQLKWSRATKTPWRGEKHHCEILRESVLAEVNRFYQVEKKMACVVSNVFTITHLLTSANSCWSISRTRTRKLPPPASSLGPAPWDCFPCSHT